MTTTIQNLSDLQDRRIMMDKKLPPYGYAFVILTGLFMIFLVIWSTQTNRIYVSQNSGVVQAANKTYIMSSYSGSITELYVSEGSYVNEGDLIARLKTSSSSTCTIPCSSWTNWATICPPSTSILRSTPASPWTASP